MKNKTLAILGVITWVLSVLSSAEDLQGNYVAPTFLILISVIATIIFTILASIRLWKTERITIILFLVSSLITLVYVSVPVKVIHFILFIWIVSLLWAMAKNEKSIDNESD